ncbi:molecular chaperone HtpG [Soehngenia longivitae]|uniref:Chaperone protein HtpG n=1 Tax=Soehngenia longivitae TaxID=2562294 RepID=A0A4Z0D9S4_9FIRM|nr:molecular chaperone HtpG [Soehngenia longivitae]TFZ41605.1 molecular chaperone HtpG [Soehngenia longivitae]
MEKKEFQAESKQLLDLMINSIYTHKEIFLRELISNASDAIDKIYYKAITDKSISFNKDDYYIQISFDKENRTLSVKDTGIGMTKEELENNLGVIARSGSLQFKKENEIKDGYDIIGQFGVGFYSSFMVADKVTVITRPFGSDKAWEWESEGIEGYTIEETTKDEYGTEVILKIKENTEDENYDDYLDEYNLMNLVKKYSDFIRYPIKMEVSEYKKKEDSDEYETVKVEKTINSMVPIWRRNKNELTDEDYINFYQEKRFGFDKPLKWIHLSIDGAVRYNAILYIPSTVPYDYYSREYEKGLELYSSGVMIMEKCKELLPDYFSFVKGVVDSEDLSLNISREMLQHDRQLRLMAKKIEEKIREELLNMLKEDREKYEEFFKNFGKQLKYGIYQEFGMNKDKLEDLLLFYSSSEKKLVTLDEYTSRIKEGQEYIYYASGDNYDLIDKLPQTEIIKDNGYEILYLIDEVDEFALKVMRDYKGKEFKSVSSEDLGIEEEKVEEGKETESKEIFEKMKELLQGKVSKVRLSKRLKNHPVCLASEGEISIEMEKVLKQMPEGSMIKAEKILEINPNHQIYEKLKNAYEHDEEKFKLYTNLLYDQARLIEGLPIEDPIEFANNISKLM